MQKTQFIELFNNIRKTKVTFFSIAFFVTLTTASFFGVGWTIDGINSTIDSLLNKYNFQDIEINYPYGFSDEVINDLNNLDEAYTAEGEYVSYQFFNLNKSIIQAKVVSLTNKVNIVETVEGYLPTNNYECAIEKCFADKYGIKLNDQITFIHDDDGSMYQLKAIIDNDEEAIKNDKQISEDGMAYLINDTYTVTAFIDSPEHLGKYEQQLEFSTSNNQVNVIIYVNKDAFDVNVLPGYTKVLLRSSSLRDNLIYSDEYSIKNDELQNQIKAFFQDYTNDKNNEILNDISSTSLDISTKIADGEESVNNSKQEIAEYEKQILNATNELASVKKQLEDYQVEINDNYSKLNSAQNELNNAKNNKQNVEITFNVLKVLSNPFINLYAESTKSLLRDYSDVLDEIKEFIDLAINDSLSNDTYGNTINDINTILDGKTIDEFITEFEATVNELSNPLIKTGAEALLNATKSFFNSVDEFIKFNDNETKLIKILEYETKTKQLFVDEIVKEVNENISSYSIDIETALTPYIDLEDIKESRSGVISNIGNKTVIYQASCTVIDNFDDIWKTFNNKQNEINNYSNELQEKQDELSQNWDVYYNESKKLDDSKQQLKDAISNLNDAKENLSTSKKDYNDYLDATSAVKAYEATLIGGQTNHSIVSSKLVVNVISQVRNALAILFLIVGVFVSYTSTARLVYDQTIQIGTKKALGLRRFEITMSLFLYVALACLLGISIGFFLSRYVIEPVFSYGLIENYNIHYFNYYIDIKEYFLFSSIEVLIIIIATYLASRKILNRETVKLLSGDDQTLGKKHFYENSSIWKKTSLFTKSIINNCFNDTRRVFATVVDIVGCTTLIVAALSFNNNIEYSLDRQINELSNFDTIVNLKSEAITKDITNKLDELNIDYTLVSRNIGITKTSDDKYVGLTLYTSNTDELYDYSKLVYGNKDVRPNDGIVVSESYSKQNDANIGDEFIFIDSLGKQHSFTIEGIFENYQMGLCAYIDGDLYEKEFDEEISINLMYLRRNNLSIDDIENAICNYEGYLSIVDNEESIRDTSKIVSSISLMLFVIFLFLSVALSFLVTLNLFVMFVDEKKKETIVLMINGYSKKAAKKYIYLDTIFLTLIGMIIGSIFGGLAGAFTTSCFNSASTSYMIKVLPKTYIISSLITILLSTINSLIALRRIDKYKLTEINTK